MWKQNKLVNTPWTKMDPLTLRFLKLVLHPDPKKRCTIPEIKIEKWYMRNHSTLKSKSPRSGASPRDGPTSIKRFCSSEGAPTPLAEKCQNTRLSLSQPVSYRGQPGDIVEAEGGENEGGDSNTAVFFSQPLHIEDMLLSQIASTPGSSQNPFAHLIKRLTRFNISLSLEDGMKAFVKVVEKCMLQHKVISHTQVRIQTVDKRKSTLTYLVNFRTVGQLPLLLDFQKLKGDGIEFKRQFKNIKGHMNEYLV